MMARLVIYFALPCGMRLRSLANSVGRAVGFRDEFIRLRWLLLAAA